jgi:nitroreductase
MISLGEAIGRRQSVRSYRSEDVPRDAVIRLLEMAVRAPTAMHQEAWGFVVVQDRDLLRRISDVARPLFLKELHMRAPVAPGARSRPSPFAEPDFNVFYDAGTLVVICAPAQAPFGMADCWLAAENLVLAACASGISSCVIGSAVSALNEAGIKSELGLPPEYEAIAPIILGYAAQPGAPTTRREPRIFSWIGGSKT